MGILDVLPEEYDYVDYRPTLATSLLGAGATIGTVLAARGLMKGFGKKTGKGLSGSKTKMKGSVNLNKRPGKVKGPKKSKKLKKAAKGAASGTSSAAAAAEAAGESLPMYEAAPPKYSPQIPPRKAVKAPEVPPGPANPFSDYYKVKKKGPATNPFADKYRVKKAGPAVNPFSDRYGIGVKQFPAPPKYTPKIGKPSSQAKMRTKVNFNDAKNQTKIFSKADRVQTKGDVQKARVKNVAMMEAFQREAAKTYKARPKKNPFPKRKK